MFIGTTVGALIGWALSSIVMAIFGPRPSIGRKDKETLPCC